VYWNVIQRGTRVLEKLIHGCNVCARGVVCVGSLDATCVDRIFLLHTLTHTHTSVASNNMSQSQQHHEIRRECSELIHGVQNFEHRGTGGKLETAVPWWAVRLGSNGS